MIKINNLFGCHQKNPENCDISASGNSSMNNHWNIRHFFTVRMCQSPGIRRNKSWAQWHIFCTFFAIFASADSALRFACAEKDWPTASGLIFAICLFARNFCLRSKQAIERLRKRRRVHWRQKNLHITSTWWKNVYRTLLMFYQCFSGKN